MTECSMEVRLAGLKLKNPLVLASGTAGHGLELKEVVDISEAGAITLKSVTVEPCLGNPEPRLWETTGGMLNSIGLENVGIEAFVEDIGPGLEDLGLPVIASISGDTFRSYARLASRMEELDALAALEVNVSCPNVEKGGVHFGADTRSTASVVKGVRSNCSLPVFVKLSAAVSDIARVAEAAVEAGASGLSLINTLPGMAIDIAGRRPRLGGVTGGLSGPAIKPVALKAVFDCHRVTGLPIIGGGGVYDARDVVEFMLAGATAVSVGTATFQDPAAVLRIIKELPAAVSEAGASSAGELTGALRHQSKGTKRSSCVDNR